MCKPQTHQACDVGVDMRCIFGVHLKQGERVQAGMLLNHSGWSFSRLHGALHTLAAEACDSLLDRVVRTWSASHAELMVEEATCVT